MKFSIFTGEKNLCILHGQVFVMDHIFFFSCKNENFQQKSFVIFLIFAQNLVCGYTTTLNLCFGAKIKKIGIPLHTRFSI